MNWGREKPIKLKVRYRRSSQVQNAARLSLGIITYRVFVALACFTLACGYLGKQHWVLDLFSHFRMYNLLALILLAISGVWLKQYRTVVLLGACSLLVLCTLIPYYRDAPAACDQVSSLRVISINVLSENTEYQKVIDFVNEANPDILFLLEYSAAWDQGLIDLPNQFIYHKKEIREDNFGIAVYSKIPIDSLTTLSFSRYDVPSYMLSLNFKNTPLTIVGTHAIPPLHSYLFRLRTTQFVKIGHMLKQRPGEHIVIGDFNCSGFSPNFHDFLADGHLRDSRLGFGIQPSWFARTPLLRIDLDHALVSPGLEVSRRATGPRVGSDHLPVILDVCLGRQ